MVGEFCAHGEEKAWMPGSRQGVLCLVRTYLRSHENTCQSYDVALFLAAQAESVITLVLFLNRVNSGRVVAFDTVWVKEYFRALDWPSGGKQGTFSKSEERRTAVHLD